MSAGLIGSAFGTIVMVALAFAAMRMSLHRPLRRRSGPLSVAGACILMATFGVVLVVLTAAQEFPS